MSPSSHVQFQFTSENCQQHSTICITSAVSGAATPYSEILRGYQCTFVANLTTLSLTISAFL